MCILNQNNCLYFDMKHKSKRTAIHDSSQRKSKERDTNQLGHLDQQLHSELSFPNQMHKYTSILDQPF